MKTDEKTSKKLGKIETPMLDKITRLSLQGKPQTIGKFLKWLSETKGVQLADSYDQLSDEFFGIDRAEAEREEELRLEEYRSGRRRLSYNPRA